MAIGVGSIVAVKVSSAQLDLGNACAQPPAFGCNESASGPFTITWANNGNRVAGIPSTSLDEITNAGSPAQALFGQVVNFVGASPAMSGPVIMVYARSAVDVVLIKCVSTGAFLEALASAVTAQAGQ
jgi:hypothetical protein